MNKIDHKNREILPRINPINKETDEESLSCKRANHQCFMEQSISMNYYSKEGNDLVASATTRQLLSTVIIYDGSCVP